MGLLGLKTLWIWAQGAVQKAYRFKGKVERKPREVGGAQDSVEEPR